MSTGAATAPGVDQVRMLADQTVYLPRRGEAPVPASLTEMRAGGGLWLVAFSSLELAVSAQVGQDDVFTTSLWDALRLSRPGTGVVVDPGQDQVFPVSDEVVQAVLGGRREDAPPLSPTGFMRLAGTEVHVLVDDAGRAATVQDDRSVVCVWREEAAAVSAGRGREDYTARAGALGDLVRSLAPGTGVVVDPGLPQQLVLDAGLVERVRIAHGLFPPGVPVARRRPEAELLARAERLRRMIDADRVWAVELCAEGGSPRLLLLVAGPVPDLPTGDDEPVPVWVAPLDELAPTLGDPEGAAWAASLPR